MRLGSVVVSFEELIELDVSITHDFTPLAARCKTRRIFVEVSEVRYHKMSELVVLMDWDHQGDVNAIIMDVDTCTMVVRFGHTAVVAAFVVWLRGVCAENPTLEYDVEIEYS